MVGQCLYPRQLHCQSFSPKIKDYPFEVVIPTGMKVQGASLSDQIKNLDWRVGKAKFVDHLPDSITKEVTAKITALIRI